MKDVLIVYSGGLDSTVLLHDFSERVGLAVTFDYGSNHAQKEIECAIKNCKRLKVKHVVVELPFFKGLFSSSLLDGADSIPTGEYSEGNMQSTVVPFRNGIFLSIAAGIAESNGLKYVAIANHSGDHFIYPDCRTEFISAMDSAVDAGTDGRVKILSPYQNISKTAICEIGHRLGVHFEDTWSCYKGGEYHCGKCATCIERHQSFEALGVKDPTVYRE